ncbi:hypothetical protein, partial [Escherichia coli]|uniref:hypothetical protein n=2 Tax=Escherichia coli TaxID=562 RepID=UPI001BC8523C
IMRTNAHLPEKKIFKLPDTRKNKPPQLTKPRHRLLDSVMRDETINSINKHQSRLNDSRLAPFVSMTAMKTRLCRGRVALFRAL